MKIIKYKYAWVLVAMLALSCTEDDPRLDVLTDPANSSKVFVVFDENDPDSFSSTEGGEEFVVTVRSELNLLEDVMVEIDFEGTAQAITDFTVENATFIAGSETPNFGDVFFNSANDKIMVLLERNDSLSARTNLQLNFPTDDVTDGVQSLTLRLDTAYFVNRTEDLFTVGKAGEQLTVTGTIADID
jgi:hypothetical protein